MTPLLECREARLDGPGGPLVEGLTVVVSKSTVVLSGAFTALLDACVGRARLVSGSVRLGGVPLEEVTWRTQAGIFLRDPPLAADWTAGELLAESAALLGLGRGAAKRLARSALARLGLEDVRKQRLDRVDEATRRAVLLAHATLGDPPLLVIASPLTGLDDAAASAVARVLDRARDGRRLIAMVDALGAEGPDRRLVTEADEALFATRDGLVLEAGAAGEGATRYLVTALHGTDALAEALSAAGAAVRRIGSPGHPRLVVEPATPGTRAIVESATRVGAPVVELVPLPATLMPIAREDRAGHVPDNR